MSFLPKEKQKSKSEPMICAGGLSAKRWMWVTRGGGLDVPGAGVAQTHAVLSDSEGHKVQDLTHMALREDSHCPFFR